MTTTLIKGAHVVCGIAPDGTAEVIEDGALLFREGEITAVGTREELSKSSDIATTIGGEQFVVFPGFVNSHHHVGLTPLQLGIPDLPLELWLNRRLGCKSVDIYLDTLYSAFEMLRSGVTTVQHLHEDAPGTVDHVYKTSTDLMRAYEDIGMRLSYSYGIRDQNCIVYEDDQAFIRRLPPALGKELSSMFDDKSIPMLPLNDYFWLFETLVAEYADHDTIKVQLNLQNLHWCSDSALERAADVARLQGVPIHMHALETPYQKEYAKRRSGQSAIDHLRKFELLSPATTLGHGVWTSEKDLDLIADTGTCICHNCSSNMRLRSGMAPVNEMRKRGISIALGIDEAGINDDRDMLQEMRLVLRTHGIPGMEDNIPTRNDVFRMATEFGANTTGFADEIGRIEPGRAADLVLVDWKQMTYPYLDADVPIVDAIVQKARTEEIHTVIVNGQLVLQDGNFLRVDEQSILDEIAESLNRPLTDQEVRMRRMGRALLPHVRNFFDDYLSDTESTPHYRMNAKQ